VKQPILWKDLQQNHFLITNSFIPLVIELPFCN